MAGGYPVGRHGSRTFHHCKKFSWTGLPWVTNQSAVGRQVLIRAAGGLAGREGPLVTFDLNEEPGGGKSRDKGHEVG